MRKTPKPQRVCSEPAGTEVLEYTRPDLGRLWGGVGARADDGLPGSRAEGVGRAAPPGCPSVLFQAPLCTGRFCSFFVLCENVSHVLLSLLLLLLLLLFALLQPVFPAPYAAPPGLTRGWNLHFSACFPTASPHGLVAQPAG